MQPPTIQGRLRRKNRGEIMITVTHTTLSAMLLALFLSSTLSANELWINHTVEEEFDTIKEYIEEGITNQGLVVAHRSDVGGMLQRTGKDLVTKVEKAAQSVMEAARSKIGMGEKEATEEKSNSAFSRSEVIEFCSAKLSRKMTDADPANVIFCPYSIAIYTTVADPNMVHVSYLQLSKIGSSKSREVLEEVEAMLEQIVSEATE